MRTVVSTRVASCDAQSTAGDANERKMAYVVRRHFGAAREIIRVATDPLDNISESGFILLL